MLLFIQSSARFLGKVTWRSVAGIIWLFLDMTDLYSRIIAPELPSELADTLQPFANNLNVATPWVVAPIVIGAVLYTYYELEKRVTRNPKIPEKLKKYFTELSQLRDRRLSEASEVDPYINETERMVAEAVEWISANMGTAAVEKFRNVPAFSGRHERAVNQRHDDAIHHLKAWTENLDALITSSDWDD